MINLPVLGRLDVTGYGLYPGAEGGEPGLHVEFKPGLTLVLGANGLGKSTLVGIIYRLLTGPFDIPGLASRADLGSMRLTTTALSAAGRAMFGSRVVDGARGARARLTFALSSHIVVIERRLSDLSLMQFSVDGGSLPTSEQETFQTEILRLVGVWSFGDWVLLLRHLIFYFEDRRALVWDPSAQRQILRFLFLPVVNAKKWTEDERAILELDSRMRNLSAALYREERALASNEIKIDAGVDVRRELQRLEKLQGTDQQQLERLEGEVIEVETARQQTRLRLLKAEQEREARFRELERAKLTAIGARFPDRTETARYILAQLMTEHVCLVCDHVAAEAAADYGARIDHKKCVVCGTDLSADDTLVPAAGVADKRVERVTADLYAIESDLSEARRSLDEAEGRYQAHLNEIQELNSKIAERSRRIDGLVRRLPPAEVEIHKQRSELASMRSRVEELKADLFIKRNAFRKFVEQVSRELANQSDIIKRTFNSFAEGFLLETCRLVWSPQKARVGETGDLIDFPAFELEMTGADFPSPVRRTGPEQVSESQREFIDLAFRMALMAVAGSSGCGTLVIDAPESSLDAVFVTRAANVLSRFAEPTRGNRLVITSNLVEGRLIPSLVEKVTPATERMSRIVDLFTIAAPTAAVRELRDEYDRIREKLLNVEGGDGA
jgi:predicted  nucleic acid-binding Zn-ribbon protein